jgi:general secretion pathway protein F
MQFTVSGIRESTMAKLFVEAANRDEARISAEAQGVAVISVHGLGWQALSFGRRRSFPLIQFNQGLHALISAGLSLVEGIEALAEREARAEIKQVLKMLLAKLYEGASLSAALEAQPDVFPPIYVATIRANEKTGALAEAIERFIHYRSQIDLVRKRVTAAAIYPSLILAVGGLVILFLLLYVVPRFAQVFDDLGDRIPAMSRLLLQWGQLVHEHGLAVLLVLCAVPLAVLLLLARPEVRAWLGRAVTRIPRIGEFVRVYQLARFYRTLGMLLRAGIPAVPALSMVTALLPMSLRAALDEARHEVEEGRSLSMALDAHRLATPVSLRMMRVGERTGQMGEMMERIAAFHDDDVAQTIDWFVRLFEPLLMVALGVIIGVIVLLMYAPIFELAGAIQ